MDSRPTYRLNSTELNALIYQRIREFNPQTFSLDGVHKLHLVKRHNRNYIVFPMCKDSADGNNMNHVPYFYDFLKEFNKKHTKKDYIFLIPILKCRGLFGLPTSVMRRMHAVLWVQDQLLTSCPVEQDSQSWMADVLLRYPNKRKELNLPKATMEDTAYGQQGLSDNYSCGYYTAEYLYLMLKDGNLQQCADVSLSIPSQYPNGKEAFLKESHVRLDYSLYVLPEKYPQSAEEFMSVEEKAALDDDCNWEIVEENQGIAEDGKSILTWEIEEDGISVEGSPSYSSPLLAASLFKGSAIKKSASSLELNQLSSDTLLPNKKALSYSQ